MKTETIGAFEAMSHFSQLLEREHQGTVFIVTRRGNIAQLRPNEPGVCLPVFGSGRGKVHISADFDEPLADMAEYTL